MNLGCGISAFDAFNVCAFDREMEIEEGGSEGGSLAGPSSPSSLDRIKALLGNGAKTVDSEPKILLRAIRMKQKPTKNGLRKSIKKGKNTKKKSKKKLAKGTAMEMGQ